ncbi:MAG: hypothetical protein R6V45_11070, partial [Oceanipulchritudo sp.]
TYGPVIKRILQAVGEAPFIIWHIFVFHVFRDTREKLDILMPGGGYALSPTHQLQDNSRTENVLALYQTAREYGRYDRR